MPLFVRVERVQVPVNVAVCPECGLPLYVDDHKGQQLLVSCMEPKGHRYKDIDWQPIRNLIQGWASGNVVAY